MTRRESDRNGGEGCRVDLVIAVGGDSTLLRAAHSVADSVVLMTTIYQAAAAANIVLASAGLLKY